MAFRIADTFTDSLDKIKGDEQEGRQNHGIRPADGSGESGDAVS